MPQSSTPHTLITISLGIPVDAETVRLAILILTFVLPAVGKQKFSLSTRLALVPPAGVTTTILVAHRPRAVLAAIRPQSVIAIPIGVSKDALAMR